jgi:glucose/arabinose dehydrogenase
MVWFHNNIRESVMKVKYIVGMVILFSLTIMTLIGCQFAQDLLQNNVETTIAPTSIPLLTGTQAASPTANPTPQSPDPTDNPTAVPEVVPPAEPTRIMAPQQTINLPPGFGISVYAEGLRDPRMMTLGPDGELYVAERGANRIIRLPDRDGDGVADAIEIVATDFRSPNSIVFAADGSLYVGETTRIVQVLDPDGDGVFQELNVVIDGLPSGGHSTRTVTFSPDNAYLYVSIGSSCNVCAEDDPRRAAIVRYKPDGSDETLYAEGLRNAVGITFRPGTGELWVTNNGRDWLGNDQPPETIYQVAMGDDVGWPRCHAGRIVDPHFGQSGACEGVLAPEVEMQAHSAPLGLNFYTGTQFPEAYRGDLFVAFHGSWNRTPPTGYKVVHIPIEDGKPGAAQDFAVGWLRADGSQWGRPVDVITGPDGSLYLSDDGGGRIYRIFYAGE